LVTIITRSPRHRRSARDTLAIHRLAHALAIRVHHITNGRRKTVVTGCTRFRFTAPAIPRFHFVRVVRAAVLRITATIIVAVLKKTGALAVGIQHVVHGAGIRIIAGGTGLSRLPGAIVQRIADPVTITVRAWSSHAIAIPIQHIIDGARVAIVALPACLTGNPGATVLCIAESVAIAVHESAHALAAFIQHIVDRAGIAIVTG